MKIHIETDVSQLAARKVALFLSFLPILRDGLGVAIDGTADEFVKRLSRALREDLTEEAKERLIYEAKEKLINSGAILLRQHDWPVLPALWQEGLTHMLLEVSPIENDLELVSINTGSIDTILAN